MYSFGSKKAFAPIMLPSYARSTAFVVGSVALLFCRPARPAERTRVADAFVLDETGQTERKNPIDIDLTVGFSSQRETGKITRESFERPGIVLPCSEQDPLRCLPVDELDYKRATNRLNLSVEFGIAQDLSLTIGWSYVTGQDLSFGYANGVDATTSSIDPQTGDPGSTLFSHDFASKNRGSGPLEFALKWAPLSNQSEETTPTWMLFFAWSTPWTSKVFDPRQPATLDNPGPVGDGVHRLTFGTALSKRIGKFAEHMKSDSLDGRRGYFDPYVEVSYTLPLPQDGLALDALVENRDNPFGRAPSAEFNAKAGFEIIVLENLEERRRLAVDLGVDSSLFTGGRNYSLLSNPLNELTFEEQHMRLLGNIGLYYQASDYLRIKSGFQIGFVTDHFLTIEEAGEDRDGDGQVIAGSDDLANPFFCGFDSDDVCSRQNRNDPIDQVGFRFRDEQHLVLSWFVSLQLMF